MPLPAFISEILEVQIASFRRQQIPANFLVPKPGDAPTRAAGNGTYRHKKIDDELRDKALKRLDKGESIPQVARTCAVSKSTVRRWREEAAEIVQQILNLADQVVCVSDIARKLKLSEAFVTEILARRAEPSRARAATIASGRKHKRQPGSTPISLPGSHALPRKPEA